MSRECWPANYVPLNGCAECCLDFTSLAAFDRHRVGTHAYPWSLRRRDGRRCLDPDELESAGLCILDGEELTRTRFAERARFGVVLVHDPEAAERVRRRFAEREVADAREAAA
jgi:hypothetical protein